MDEASDFKFGNQLGFAKSHYLIQPEEKVCGLGPGELPEIWGFLFNINATAEASDFKFGTQLVFAKAHHKMAPGGKIEGGLWLGMLPNILGFPKIFLQRLGLATSNLACSWGLPRPIMKSHEEERVDMALG